MAAGVRFSPLDLNLETLETSVKGVLTESETELKRDPKGENRLSVVKRLNGESTYLKWLAKITKDTVTDIIINEVAYLTRAKIEVETETEAGAGVRSVIEKDVDVLPKSPEVSNASIAPTQAITALAIPSLAVTTIPATTPTPTVALIPVTPAPYSASKAEPIPESLSKSRSGVESAKAEPIPESLSKSRRGVESARDITWEEFRDITWEEEEFRDIDSPADLPLRSSDETSLRSRGEVGEFSTDLSTNLSTDLSLSLSSSTEFSVDSVDSVESLIDVNELSIDVESSIDVDEEGENSLEEVGYSAGWLSELVVLGEGVGFVLDFNRLDDDRQTTIKNI